MCIECVYYVFICMGGGMHMPHYKCGGQVSALHVSPHLSPLLRQVAC